MTQDVSTLTTEQTPPESPASSTEATPTLWRRALAEALGTGLLVAIVVGSGIAAQSLSPDDVGLQRAGRTGWIPAAVGAYIGAAYWFTSSTSFANPAVTVGRIFSDTFAGIDPSSVLPFVAAQVIGGALGVLIATTLYPRAESEALKP